MERRFHMMVEFKALSEESIKKLCARFFHALSFSEEQVETLAEYESVTPGDFSALHSRFRFMNPAELTAEHVARELEALQKEKKNNCNAHTAIGFSA